MSANKEETSALEGLSPDWIDSLDLQMDKPSSSGSHPPILISPEQDRKRCRADRERPLVLFSPSRVLLKRSFANGRHSFEARPGLGELLRLFEAGFRVGIYTNSKMYATVELVSFLYSELDKTVRAAAQKNRASQKRALGNEPNLVANDSAGSHENAEMTSNQKNGRKPEDTSRGGEDNASRARPVSEETRRIIFWPIFNREHGRRRVPGHPPLTAGTSWDQYKPLAMHVSDLSWTTLVEDKLYRALDGEKHRFVVVSSTQDPEAAARDGGKVLKALVDGLLEGLAKARNEESGEKGVYVEARSHESVDDSDEDQPSKEAADADLMPVRARRGAARRGATRDLAGVRRASPHVRGALAEKLSVKVSIDAVPSAGSSAPPDDALESEPRSPSVAAAGIGGQPGERPDAFGAPSSNPSPSPSMPPKRARASPGGGSGSFGPFPPALVAPPEVRGLEASPSRPLVLFDLNGVLVQHDFHGGGRHLYAPRPGLARLRELAEAGAQVGIYTSSSRRTVGKAVRFLYDAMELELTRERDAKIERDGDNTKKGKEEEAEEDAEEEEEAEEEGEEGGESEEEKKAEKAASGATHAEFASAPSPGVDAMETGEDDGAAGQPTPSEETPSGAADADGRADGAKQDESAKNKNKKKKKKKEKKKKRKGGCSPGFSGEAGTRGAGPSEPPSASASPFPLVYPLSLWPILCREHCRPASPEDIARRGGKPWDTVKPLSLYVTDADWVALVDDSDHKALPEEKARLLLVPSWEGPGKGALRDDDRILDAVVDGILQAIRKSKINASDANADPDNAHADDSNEPKSKGPGATPASEEGSQVLAATGADASQASSVSVSDAPSASKKPFFDLAPARELLAPLAARAEAEAAKQRQEEAAQATQAPPQTPEAYDPNAAGNAFDRAARGGASGALIARAPGAPSSAPWPTPLHWELAAFARLAAPTREEAAAARLAHATLQSIVQALWQGGSGETNGAERDGAPNAAPSNPAARIVLAPFGSRAMGTSLPGSNADFTVLGLDPETERAALVPIPMPEELSGGKPAAAAEKSASPAAQPPALPPPEDRRAADVARLEALAGELERADLLAAPALVVKAYVPVGRFEIDVAKLAKRAAVEGEAQERELARTLAGEGLAETTQGSSLPASLSVPTLRVDVTVARPSAPEAARFFRAALAAEPCARPLLLALKALLRERRLSTPFTGGLSSYSIANAVLAIRIEQRKAAKGDEASGGRQGDASELPWPRGTADYGALLYDAFDLLTRRIDHVTQALSVLGGGVVDDGRKNVVADPWGGEFASKRGDEKKSARADGQAGAAKQESPAGAAANADVTTGQRSNDAFSSGQDARGSASPPPPPRPVVRRGPARLSVLDPQAPTRSMTFAARRFPAIRSILGESLDAVAHVLEDAATSEGGRRLGEEEREKFEQLQGIRFNDEGARERFLSAGDVTLRGDEETAVEEETKASSTGPSGLPTSSLSALLPATSVPPSESLASLFPVLSSLFDVPLAIGRDEPAVQARKLLAQHQAMDEDEERAFLDNRRKNRGA